MNRIEVNGKICGEQMAIPKKKSDCLISASIVKNYELYHLLEIEIQG